MMDDVADDLNPVFKALADPTRRQLLDRLHERNGQTLGELCGSLAMARQSASQHLALLEAANLISTDRRGREKLHHLNPVPCTTSRSGGSTSSNGRGCAHSARSGTQQRSRR